MGADKRKSHLGATSKGQVNAHRKAIKGLRGAGTSRREGGLAGSEGQWTRAAWVGLAALATAAAGCAIALRGRTGERGAFEPYDLERAERVRGFNGNSNGPEGVDDGFRGGARGARSALPAGARVFVASWEPRILVVDGLLDAGEAARLLEKVRGLSFERTLLATANGSFVVQDNTISSYIAIAPQDDATVRLLRARIAAISSLPQSHHEAQVAVKYAPGQHFRGHLDVHVLSGRPTSRRAATCLTYLNDIQPGRGGELYFPLARPVSELPPNAGIRRGAPTDECRNLGGKDPSVQSESEMGAYLDGSESDSGDLKTGADLGVTSGTVLTDINGSKPELQLGSPGALNVGDDLKSGAKGLSIMPRKGRAVLFWGRKLDGSLERRARHAGCPTLDEEKFLITTWIHGECADVDSQPGCAAWAAAGECENNVPFMHSDCKRSCGLC